MVPAAEVTASFHWLASRLTSAADRARPAPAGRDGDEEPVLGRLGSRNRVSGYAAAVFETVTVDRARGDRGPAVPLRPHGRGQPAAAAAPSVTATSPVAVRQQADRPAPRAPGAAGHRSVWRPTPSAAVGPATSCATLDALVEDAARARGWRVARVQAADRVDDAQRRDLSEALGRLTGRPVELQVTMDPQLLGGVVVAGRRPAGRRQRAAPARRTEGAPPRYPRRPTEFHEGRERSRWLS